MPRPAAMTTSCKSYGWFEDLRPIVGLAASPDDRYIAYVQKRRSRGEASFKSSLVIEDATTGSRIRDVEAWSFGQLRFSCDARRISFVQHGVECEKPELVFQELYCDGRQTVEVEQEIVETAWSRKGLFVVVAQAPKTRTCLRIRSVAERLPWMRQSYSILQVQYLEGRWKIGFAYDCGEMVDVKNLSVLNDELYFTSTVCADGKNLETRIHRLNPNGGELVTLVAIPSENVFGLTISPLGKYLAFHAPRVLDDRSGGPINYYDTRAHVYDVERCLVWPLQRDAAIASSVQQGLYPTSQDIHWICEETLIYVCMRGVMNHVCETNVYGDPYYLEKISSGSSFLHCFTEKSNLYCISSDFGLPFVIIKRACIGGRFSQPEVGPSSFVASYQFQKAEKIELDGSCESWLYLPSWPKGQIPLVVFVYGGPFTVCLGFDDVHQLLVGFGIAVLVVNPPGCSGYGSNLADALVNDWGACASPQIVKATLACLAKVPQLNAAALGIYGASYGGFLALRVVNQCDLFKTCVAIAPITNIPSYWGGSRFGFIFGGSTLYHNFPYDNAAFFVKRSPMFNCRDINCPVLLLHGDCDFNVPCVESEQMFLSLKLQDKEVEYMLFQDECHGLRSTPESAYVYGRIISSWFDAHLNDAASAWADALLEI
jgi:dienelactone hydrolase